jgi:hypothetical protein
MVRSIVTSYYAGTRASVLTTRQTPVLKRGLIGPLREERILNLGGFHRGRAFSVVVSHVVYPVK